MRQALAVILLCTASMAMWAADALRDGNPRLGDNFLMPYDSSRFDAAKVGGTLRGFDSTTKGLNPIIDNSSNTSAIHGLCNDSLCARPPWAPEQWMEELAESCVISDDYLTYTFRIRPGILWQRPVCAKQAEFAWLDKDVALTAHDFVFAVTTILNPQVECPQLRNYYEDIDKAEAVDDRTLVIRWKKKVYNSLSASMGLSPLPRHIYGRNRDGGEIPAERFGSVFNKHWFDDLRGVCGVGNYILAEYRPDQQVRFVRNPAYWGAGQHFDELLYDLNIKEDAAQLVAFKNGQVHADGLSPLLYKSEILDRGEPRFAGLDEQDPKAGRKGELGWERVQGMSFSYFGWNMRRAPFDDVRVRQAMSHALPKTRIIKDILFGLGNPILSDVHPSSQYYNKDLKPYLFDLKKAAALLKAAGWEDSDGDGLLDKEVDGKRQNLSFTLKYWSHRPEWDNLISVYRNELRKIGVDMKPLTLEWKELLRVYEDKDFEAIVGGWAMDMDVDYYQLWHSSQAEVQGGSNHCGFKNARVDELAVKLRATFDTNERIAIAKEIQGILHQEQPYTFFTSGVGVFVWQNKAPAGQPNNGRYLDGVITGLETLHPLKNRAHATWFLPR